LFEENDSDYAEEPSESSEETNSVLVE